VDLSAVAGDIVLTSERLETACLGAKVSLALLVMYLTMASHVLWIREAKAANWTFVSSFLEQVVDAFVVSATLSADIHSALFVRLRQCSLDAGPLVKDFTARRAYVGTRCAGRWQVE
jgi:hypothetical protein